jgi:hypothetical protein
MSARMAVTHHGSVRNIIKSSTSKIVRFTDALYRRRTEFTNPLSVADSAIDGAYNPEHNTDTEPVEHYLVTEDKRKYR